MKTHITSLVAAMALAASGFGQITIVASGAGAGEVNLGATYTQDFDTLASANTGNAWTDNSTLTGWYSSRTTYNAGTGSSSTGALYSFGSAAAGDRALGGVGSSGTGTFYWGVRFMNATGAAIGGLSVSYDGEQWRDGGAATPSAQTMVVEYSFDATTISGTGNWTAIPSLEFASPIFNVSSAALDGNLAANRVAGLSVVMSSLNIADGSSIWVRFVDVDNSGSDHGLSVDNFNFAAVAIPEPSTYAMIMGVLTFGFIVYRRRQRA